MDQTCHGRFRNGPPQCSRDCTEMWDQLHMVKESKGQIGILVMYQALDCTETDKNNFNMIEHVLKLWGLQEELVHLVFEGSVSKI